MIILLRDVCSTVRFSDVSLLDNSIHITDGLLDLPAAETNVFRCMVCRTFSVLGSVVCRSFGVSRRTRVNGCENGACDPSDDVSSPEAVSFDQERAYDEGKTVFTNYIRHNHECILYRPHFNCRQLTFFSDH